MNLLANGGYSTLGRAVKNKDEAEIEKLLQEGVESDLDRPDLYDRTPLQYAGQCGYVKIGQMLIRAGCSLDITDGYGVSALHIAACNGHAEFAKMLINKGCFRDGTTSDGISPLHCASGNGRTEVVKLLLSSGVDINAIGPGKRTALYMAAENGHAEIVQLLIHAKARMNLPSDYGLTPLCSAVMNDNTDVVLLLLKHGARVNKCDARNNLPLHHAVRNGNTKLVKEILNSGSHKNVMTKAFESPVHIAVRMGHVDVLELLVDQGFDVNLCEPFDSVTPLHVGINVHQDYFLFEKLFNLLLQGGCILNWRAFSTLETPLYRAIDQDKTEIATMLLSHGADPNLTSPFDITALQKACQRGNFNVALLLLNSGIHWKREKWLTHDTVLHADVRQNAHIYDLLRKWRMEVPPLDMLCRISIRCTLGENLQKKVNQLPLPVKLQKFLMLADILQ